MKGMIVSLTAPAAAIGPKKYNASSYLSLLFYELANELCDLRVKAVRHLASLVGKNAHMEAGTKTEVKNLVG